MRELVLLNFLMVQNKVQTKSHFSCLIDSSTVSFLIVNMFNVSNHWGDDDDGEEEDKYDYFQAKTNGEADRDNHKKKKNKKKKKADKHAAQVRDGRL